MSSAKIACTACACLCDDIEVGIEENRFTRIENACIKGAALFYASDNSQRRAVCRIAGAEVTSEAAIERAARLLLKAKNPLIFGMDNSTLEAQATGIKLAKALGAVIDDTSSFCQGALIQSLFEGEIPTCSFSEANDSASLIVYWGSNPYHSHPRHLSKLSYYSHDRYHEAGWIPDVTLSCVEIRDTETTSLATPVFKIMPGGDEEFIRAIIDTASGKNQSSDAKSFTEMVEKSSFCVIFVGLGLTYALDANFHAFGEMIRMLQKSTRIAVIPMVGHFNMRGFNRSLYDETGYVNKVSFAGGITHGEEFSFMEQVRRQTADCILVIGSDPLSNLPQSLMKNLKDVSIICLDPFVTSTGNSAEVMLGTAISGVETEGTAVRMDGEEVAISRAKSTDLLSDETILQLLLDKVC